MLSYSWPREANTIEEKWSLSKYSFRNSSVFPLMLSFLNPQATFYADSREWKNMQATVLDLRISTVWPCREFCHQCQQKRSASPGRDVKSAQVQRIGNRGRRGDKRRCYLHFRGRLGQQNAAITGAEMHQGWIPGLLWLITDMKRWGCFPTLQPPAPA